MYNPGFSMALSQGSRIGSYEILSAIGVGGMGEVYRARDTKLGRDVAIKVLPDDFARDAERLARSEREAKVLASLNHPNIATIHGLEDSGGARALVMELVEGPTLADRIQQGSIPIQEALPIAKQICEALEYAHERGIIHRDLKPANIKLTRDNAVKILDFGLAKAMESEAASFDISTSPTISRLATMQGVLLGTAAYMSPEQAKAKQVDRRADIWAFGCVLYEMLTGNKAFEGDAVTETLAAVIRAEPDWTQLPSGTPMRVRVLLQRCLQKDPKQRLQSIGDARISLDEVLSGSPEAQLPRAVQPGVQGWRRALPWAVGPIAVAIAILATWYLKPGPVLPRRPVERFEIAAPEPKISFAGAFSPDGTRFLFVAPPAGNRSNRLWLRRMDSLEAHPIEGTEGVNGFPFWSPDSRFVVFNTQDGKLKKIDTEGGPAQVLCSSGPLVLGGFWTTDGKIVFGDPTRPPGLWEVPAAGGVSAPLPGFQHSGGQARGLFPVLLQDGRHFLYADGTRYSADVYLGTMDGKAGNKSPQKVLTGITARFAYVPSQDDPSRGYLLFQRGASAATPAGTLMVQRFDLQKLRMTGEPVPIAQGVTAGIFSASLTGTLAYGSGGVAGGTSQITLFDRQGKILGKVGDPGTFQLLAFSPDAKRVAAVRGGSQSATANLWIIDLVREISTRFTFDSGVDRSPVWSPDGSRIIFGSDRGGAHGLYEKLSNGGSDAQLLLKFDYGVTPLSWSDDGRFLLFGGPSNATSFSDMTHSVLPLDGNGHVAGKPFLFVQKGVGMDPRFSPGPQGHPRWVAYTSNESGRYEIYVRPFDSKSPTGTPPGGGKWQVSTEGGTSPRWNGNGKELFYVALDGTVMSVEVNGTEVFQSGIPKPLFKPTGLAPRQSDAYYYWDASSDGKKFIFPVLNSASASAPSTHFTVVLNWPSLLKK